MPNNYTVIISAVVMVSLVKVEENSSDYFTSGYMPLSMHITVCFKTTTAPSLRKKTQYLYILIKLQLN